MDGRLYLESVVHLDSHLNDLTRDLHFEKDHHSILRAHLQKISFHCLFLHYPLQLRFPYFLLIPMILSFFLRLFRHLLFFVFSASCAASSAFSSSVVSSAASSSNLLTG